MAAVCRVIAPILSASAPLDPSADLVHASPASAASAYEALMTETATPWPEVERRADEQVRTSVAPAASATTARQMFVDVRDTARQAIEDASPVALDSVTSRLNAGPAGLAYRNIMILNLRHAQENLGTPAAIVRAAAARDPELAAGAHRALDCQPFFD